MHLNPADIMEVIGSSLLSDIMNLRLGYVWSYKGWVSDFYPLANYSFEWLLPGHGLETVSYQMQQCIDWMGAKQRQILSHSYSNYNCNIL